MCIYKRPVNDHGGLVRSNMRRLASPSCAIASPCSANLYKADPLHCIAAPVAAGLCRCCACQRGAVRDVQCLCNAAPCRTVPGLAIAQLSASDPRLTFPSLSVSSPRWALPLPCGSNPSPRGCAKPLPCVDSQRDQGPCRCGSVLDLLKHEGSYVGGPSFVQ